MKKWEVSLADLIMNNIGSSITSDRILKYLKGQKLKGVNRVKVGLLMRKWGFENERFMEGEKKIRTYDLKEETVEKLRERVTQRKKAKGKIPGAIAFSCGYGGSEHYRGYYILKFGEKVEKDGCRIISREFPKGRHCTCPICHPPGSYIGMQDGLSVAHALKDKESYRAKDGPISFYDQLKHKEGGLHWKSEGPFSIGQAGKGIEIDDHSSPW